jgi:hypothetical protein
MTAADGFTHHDDEADDSMRRRAQRNAEAAKNAPVERGNPFERFCLCNLLRL